MLGVTGRFGLGGAGSGALGAAQLHRLGLVIFNRNPGVPCADQLPPLRLHRIHGDPEHESAELH